MLRISFIVPCYNLQPGQVLACLDSIRNLPLAAEEREIILVDDGSGTPVATFLGPYANAVRLIRQENGGLSRARNAALEVAGGDYIQFVDGDDALAGNGYAACLAQLQTSRPDVLMFATEGSPRRPLPQMSGAAYLSRHNLRASACGYVFRRAILGNLRFLPDMLHEDEAFTPMLLLRAKTVVDTGIEAYRYNSTPQSITTRTDTPHLHRRLADKAAIATMLSACGIERRARQVAMDCLIDALRISRHQPGELAQTVENLRRSHLFPLPPASYTPAYRLFALGTSNPLTWGIMKTIIPIAFP